ncbi:hypothetical protein OAD49_00525 [Flavobacteriaceae bacterium]|nr:hypothetical protein [Flavobacteriaceae bacterium]
MNKKKKTYLLITAVLIVWGVIAIKINNALQSKVLQEVEAVQNQSFEPSFHIEIDSFSIQKIDRDPFLGTFTKPPKKVKKPLRPPPKPKSLKQITYAGIVQKTHSKTPVFVVNINNRQYIFKKGQTVDSVTLVRGNSNEIVVRYNRQLQTVKRP